jgi:D-alanyl-D-alanine carboxypeptidase/D-alanyl-D-alanine-endopeptidase (penicillin-binding protein 4)
MALLLLLRLRLNMLVMMTSMPAWAIAQTPAPLPPPVLAALAQAKVPVDAVSLMVVSTEANKPPLLSHRTTQPMNPASVMKLVTTYAGLDLLGPAYSWRTPVLLKGTVRDGTLQGDLHLRGQGDPKLVTEKLWLLLRRVQALGVQRISGDIVLDRSAFDLGTPDPGAFDGEPLKPYNASADALLINYKSLVITFVPDPARGVARIAYEPMLAGVSLPASVPLSLATPTATSATSVGSAGSCPDYRGQLKADFSNPARIVFAGTYPAACGERLWPVAYADPANFAGRAVLGMWQEMGGQLGGSVRDGAWPTDKSAGTPQEASFELSSPPLADVIRDINKYSNNVMAQQLFLSLGLGPGPSSGTAASPEMARARLAQWWRERMGDAPLPLVDNGSGLSRQSRISASALARLLQVAYASPTMPELMSSLPLAGVDGTLKRSQVGPQGAAHLKTGSLRDVAAAAGYVLSGSGQRYVLVAMINHPNASQARPAIDALTRWVIQDL